ncbi:MAG: hypothetical protein GY784_15760 [Gammaproteobacteria bacterium]|nr:hypothetical protein [Gammaproteobacteria bacterium]
MATQPHEPDDIAAIERLLADEASTTDLDIDLSKPIEQQKKPHNNSDAGFRGSRSDAIYDDDVLSSKALISRPDSDAAIRGMSRDLERMRENQNLGSHNLQEKRIVHQSMEKPGILNVFREMRTKLIQESLGKNLVIMVASLQHGMGATFTAVNLGTVFAYEGEKTSLVVDCNQGQGKLDRIFGSNINYGLTDYLNDTGMGTDEIIYQTGISRMRYIPIGKAQESVGEYFSSERMRDFVVTVKKRYSDRYVIINAPPVEVTADAAILSEVCDHIVFVLPYGKISNQRLEKALRLMPRKKIVGFVINDVVKHV